MFRKQPCQYGITSRQNTAALVMGEGAEQTPMAIIRNAPRVHFLTRLPAIEEEKSVKISMREDLYSPLLMGAHWLKSEE